MHGIAWYGMGQSVSDPSPYPESQKQDQDAENPVARCKARSNPENSRDNQCQVESLFAPIRIRQHAPEHGTKHHPHKHGAGKNPNVLVLDLELCCEGEEEEEERIGCNANRYT